MKMMEEPSDTLHTKIDLVDIKFHDWHEIHEVACKN